MVSVGSSLFSGIGRLIRRDRTARGWSQQVLAERAGLSPSTLSRYESGKQLPERAAIDALARVFEWDLQELSARLAQMGDPAHGPAAKPDAPSDGEPAMQATLIQGVSLDDLRALLADLARDAVAEALRRKSEANDSPPPKPRSRSHR